MKKEKMMVWDSEWFSTDSNMTIDECREMLDTFETKIHSSYPESVNSQIFIECYGGTDDDGDKYSEIHLKFQRYETDEEYERRVEWAIKQINLQKESLKRMVEKDINKFKEILNELGYDLREH